MDWDDTRPYRDSPESIGLYTVEAPLDQGGFASVYRVRSLDDASSLALKLLRADHTDTESKERFLREAEALQTLSHPHIVPLLDSGFSDDGRPFLVMPLLQGETLHQRVARCGRMTPEVAVPILEQLTSAISFAHDKHIVHRDIKPSNVFLADNVPAPGVVLLDFGIAKVHDNRALTTSRHVIGTPAAMAPEQIISYQVDARTDIYSLGSLAFYALAGRMPFQAESNAILYHLHLHAVPPPPSKFAPLSSRTDAVILKAMEKEPAQRYQNAPAFFAALKESFGPAPARSRAEQTEHALTLLLEAVLPTQEGLLSEESLSEVEDLLDDAFETLTELGFHLKFETGNSGLFARDIPDDTGALLAPLYRLADTLAEQRTPAEVEWRLCVHTESAQAQGGSAHWAPGDTITGLVFTQAAQERLSLEAEAVPNIPGYYQLPKGRD